MIYEQAVEKITEALEDIERSERAIGEALTQDNATLYAAIAQAKLLAVIASALIEMKDNYIHQVHPGL